MELSLQHRIRQRAYEIWETGGQLDGQAEHDWLAAEREVLEQTNAQASASSRESTPRHKRPGTKNGLPRRKGTPVRR
jgi:hypothetical protein